MVQGTVANMHGRQKTGRRRVSDADLSDKPRLMFMQGLIPYALE
jgi:hypothetical protein